MDNAGYVNLTRQSGLLVELQTLAQNVANASTVGYRREGTVFSEFIKPAGDGGLSMASARARFIDSSQGVLNRTGGTFDFAVEGEGYFRIETAKGERLTRAGDFALIYDGDLLTSEGQRVLSADGAAITIPADAGAVSVSSDGEISVSGEVIALNPVTEISRLVEVQRAYELGQGLLEREHDRVTRLIQTLGRAV